MVIRKNSGFYKGKPFWGSWEERNNCRELFRDELIKNADRVEVILWTDYLLNDKVKLALMFLFQALI